MLNVSSLLGVSESRSDALRYGWHRQGEHTPGSSARRPPVVVWNATKGCNLTCAHCYASARRSPGSDELTTDEARAFLTDLAALGIPAVLLSGGEPLVRPDFLELVEFSQSLGLRLTLSSNGTLIDADVARRLGAGGVTYVGVSIDGDEATHDRQRGAPGAWGGAVEGLRQLGRVGVRRGVRFTLTPSTMTQLGDVLDLVESEQIERFCFYHLVPAGRGTRLGDVTLTERRRSVERAFEFAASHPDVEVLTVDNPSDGPYLYQWLLERDPARAQQCRDALAWNRGARSGPGVGLAAVDEVGDVHPDQFSRHRTLGNVRETPFSVIWSEGRHPYLQELRSADRPLPEQCTACSVLELCGGGLRSRAELATGDPWGFDPSCDLMAG